MFRNNLKIIYTFIMFSGFIIFSILVKEIIEKDNIYQFLGKKFCAICPWLKSDICSIIAIFILLVLAFIVFVCGRYLIYWGQDFKDVFSRNPLKSYESVLDGLTYDSKVPIFKSKSMLNNFFVMSFLDVNNKQNMGANGKEDRDELITLEKLIEKVFHINDNSKKKCIVIKNDAGFGKTSLIRYLCQSYNIENNQRYKNQPKLPKNVLPLYLPLYVLSEDFDSSDFSVPKYKVADFYNDPEIRFFAVCFHKFYKSHGCLVDWTDFYDWLTLPVSRLDRYKRVILLFDGFNEIAESSQKSVTEKIYKFIEKYPMIITSRTHLPLNKSTNNMSTVEIQSINNLDSQIAFIEKIYSSIEDDGVGCPGNAKNLALEFNEEFRCKDNVNLRKLGEIPFVLLAIGVLWLKNKGKPLPQIRGEIYYKLLELMLISYKREISYNGEYETNERDIIDKLDLVDHFYMLGNVAFNMVKDEKTAVSYSDLMSWFNIMLEKEIVNSACSQNTYFNFIIENRIFHKVNDGYKLNSDSNVGDYIFFHDSLKDYLAAWYLRHEDYDGEEVRDKFFLSIFDNIENFDLVDFSEERNINLKNWYEMLYFFTEIDHQRLGSNGSNRPVDVQVRREKNIISNDKSLCVLLKIVSNNEYFELLDKNKTFEIFFYSLFDRCSKVSDSFFNESTAETDQNPESFVSLWNVCKCTHKKLYILLYVLQALLENCLVDDSMSLNIAKMLTEWLSESKNIGPPLNDKEEEYIHQLTLCKAESIIRECNGKLPDWAAKSVHEIQDKDMFSSNCKRIINPHEHNAEYLFIPTDQYNNNNDSGPGKRKINPYYLARYPVTFRQYRNFIDYLMGRNQPLHQLLPPRGFKTKLLEFARYSDGKSKSKGYANNFGKEIILEDLVEKLESEYQNLWGFNHDYQPVCGVTWYDARSYCFWLSCVYFVKKFSYSTFLEVSVDSELLSLFRLPTSDEWCCAGRQYLQSSRSATNCCRGSKDVKPNDGQNITKYFHHLANFDKSINKTTQVGLYPLGGSVDGLQDMDGNVTEWQEDWSENNFGNVAYPKYCGSSWEWPELKRSCSDIHAHIYLRSMGFRVLCSLNHA